MKQHQANELLLRRVLLANAMFSTVSGLGFVLAPTFVASLLFAGNFSLLGLSPAGVTIGLGIGVLVFAGVVFLAGKPTMLRLGLAKLIIVADLLWVLDSAVLLVFFSDFLSPIGFEFVLITAVVVLAFAVGQLTGVTFYLSGPQRCQGVGRRGRHEAHRQPSDPSLGHAGLARDEPPGILCRRGGQSEQGRGA